MGDDLLYMNAKMNAFCFRACLLRMVDKTIWPQPIYASHRTFDQTQYLTPAWHSRKKYSNTLRFSSKCVKPLSLFSIYFVFQCAQLRFLHLRFLSKHSYDDIQSSGMHPARLLHLFISFSCFSLRKIFYNPYKRKWAPSKATDLSSTIGFVFTQQSRFHIPQQKSQSIYSINPLIHIAAFVVHSSLGFHVMTTCF